MPIEYQIDHDRRLVSARCTGTLTDEDVFAYQRAVWSRADVAGYDELIDMRDADGIALPSSQRVVDLASLSAAMDAANCSSKFAIVASDDLAFGLGRMYQIHRELNQRSTKEVSVFRSMDAAQAWLGR